MANKCSLLGMVVIIAGLYSFLWGSGRQRETDASLPKSASIGGGRAAGTELVGSQLTAIVVPTASPVSHSDNEQPT